MIKEIELTEEQLKAVNGACGQEWECRREFNPCDDDRRYRRCGGFFAENENESSAFNLSLSSVQSSSRNLLGII